MINLNSLKLTIELIPRSVWYSSLSRLLPGKEWRELKGKLYSEEGERCYICGSEERPFVAHEFWKYDDEQQVQKLVGVHHLCDLCHKVKHIGFWCHTKKGKEKLRREGKSREDLIHHFCKVNRCTKEEFLEHEEEAFNLWARRSRHPWKQDFGKYQKYVKKDVRNEHRGSTKNHR